MSKNKTKSALTALSMAMLLAACNGNDDDPVGAKSLAKPSTTTLKTLTVTPSLGKIINAKVRLRNAANNAILGESTTGTSGQATFNVPASVNTVIVEVQGGNGATYFDEAKNAMVTMPASTVIRAATTVVNANSEVGVTALTEAAVKRAEALAGTGNIIPHLNAAKAAVEATFGITDILKSPTLVGSQVDIANLGSTPAGQYALHLASLAKIAAQNLGATEAAPAAKMAQAIALDLADGNLDGSGNTGTLPYNLATFAAQYQQQVLVLVQDLLANASQQGFDATKLQALLSFVQSNPLELKLTQPITTPLVLTSFSTNNAVAGQEMTITGSGFNIDKTKMKVAFANNNIAEVLSATATTLVVKIPQNVVNGNVTVTNTELNQSVSKNYVAAQVIHQNARFTANFDHCHRNLPDKLGRYGDSCTASSVHGRLESIGNNGDVISSVKLPAVYPLGHFCTVSFDNGRLTITSDIPYEDGSGNFLGGTAKLNGDNSDTIIALSADNNAKVIYISMRDSLGGVSNLSASGEMWIDDAGNLSYASAYYGGKGVSCGHDTRRD